MSVLPVRKIAGSNLSIWLVVMNTICPSYAAIPSSAFKKPENDTD